jgi:hypothetical protein
MILSAFESTFRKDLMGFLTERWYCSLRDQLHWTNDSLNESILDEKRRFLAAILNINREFSPFNSRWRGYF